MSQLRSEEKIMAGGGNGGAAGRSRLRVGLLVDSLVQPRWVRHVVEDIENSSVAEIVLVVKNEAKETGDGRRGLLGKLRANGNYLLYAAYTKVDEAISKVRQDAFEKVSISDLVVGRPVIEVTPAMTKHSDYFSPDDLLAIRVYDLDVALRFGFRILRGEALTIAKHGVWSYHHADGLINRGGPPGFWEVMLGEPLTGSMLQVLTEELDNGKVLYRSWSSTNEKFSVRRNKNNYYWKSSAFVLRKLLELYECDGCGLPDEGSSKTTFRPYHHRLYQKPTNAEMVPLLSKLAGRAAKKLLRDAVYLEQWCLAYQFKSGADNGSDALYRFKYLIPPKDRFWADPFPVKVRDKYFVFFEEYIYRKDKAHISAVEMDTGGAVGVPFKVLEKEYHLSYPFVFEWQDDYYMIPESGANRTVELYRCHSFPSEWQLESVFMEGVRAVDTTVAEVEGTWWMFLNIASDDVSYNYDELYLFHAESPLGPWQPHRRNPVKSDARSARPAGRLFRWKGELYRPAQDCSGHYGYAISINRIVRLNPQEFREEEVSRILPAWNKSVIATHTLNSCGGLTVIDCKIRRSKFLQRSGQTSIGAK
jgi:hypothetical protein